MTRRRLLLVLGFFKLRSLLLAEGKRDRFIRLTESDLALETQLEMLGEHWITANDDFFVLSREQVHISEEESANWHVTVTGEVGVPLSLALAKLRDPHVFPRSELYACIQCAGYGRRFFEPAFDVVPWGRGAIGNAFWGGVRLRDVLRRAKLSPSVKHIAFAGKDCTQVDPPYIKSIPLDKAVEPNTLLVFQMNGSDLPTAHGGPLRLLVPGWAGTYSLKWLQRIEASRKPWEGYWMSVAYQLPTSPIEPGSPAGTFPSIPIEAIRVNSLISRPLDEDRILAGESVVEGFAWSGTAEVDRVDVSIDGGQTWRLANWASPSHRFAWRRWRLPWHPARGVYAIVARAHDRSGAMQPLERSNWNPGGYGWQTAHSLRVMVV